MSNTHVSYMPTDGVSWTGLVEEAKREARRDTAHIDWELDYVDEFHREMDIRNDDGRKVGIELQAKVVLRKA